MRDDGDMMFEPGTVLLALGQGHAYIASLTIQHTDAEWIDVLVEEFSVPDGSLLRRHSERIAPSKLVLGKTHGLLATPAEILNHMHGLSPVLVGFVKEYFDPNRILN